MALETTPLIAALTASDSTEGLNYSSEYYIIEYLSDPDVDNEEIKREQKKDTNSHYNYYNSC